MDKKAILFDFDLTLADSSKAICTCMNYALGKMGHRSRTYEEIKKTIGLAVPKVYTLLTGIHDSEQEQQFFDHFIKKADELITKGTEFFPGVKTTLQKLKEKYRLGIVTTKFRYRIEDIFIFQKFEDVFEVIIGGDDVQNFKPDPEGLFLACEKLGIEVKDSVFVGDSLSDAGAAQGARMDFIASLTGTTQRTDFLDYDVLWFIEHVDELLDLN